VVTKGSLTRVDDDEKVNDRHRSDGGFGLVIEHGTNPELFERVFLDEAE
jgi:hypothetical protein